MRAVALGLVAGAVLIAAPAAGAAPVWSAPVTISVAGQPATEADVAVNARGLAVAAWRRFDGSAWVIASSTRPPGGQWSTPQSLSLPSSSAFRPRVAMNDSDQVIVVWERGAGGANRVVEYAARAAVGQQWTVGALDPGRFGRVPEVAIDGSGNAAAAWEATDEAAGTRIRARARRGGAWDPAADLSNQSQNSRRPRVAATATGAAVVVWQTDVPGAGRLIQSSSNVLFNNAGWQGISIVSPIGEFASDAEVATDTTIRAAVVWTSIEGTTRRVRVATAEPLTSGTWNTLQVASDTAALSQPSVDVTAAGGVMLTWRRGTGASATGFAAAGTIQGSGFGAFTTASRSETPVVSWRSGAANGVIVYRGQVGNRLVIQAAVRRGATQRWSSGVTLSDDGLGALASPRYAGDGAGGGVAVWTQNDGIRTRVQAATLAETPFACRGQDAHIVGSAFADRIDGTAFNDVIATRGGNDVARGFAGGDRICLAAGADTAYGGTGNDQVDGGGGADTIFGEDGADILLGGAGNDVVRGGAGTDNLLGGGGNDDLYGEAANDQIAGGSGTDRGFGGTGSDFCAGDVEVTNSCD